jgi:hypothetical protein
LGADAQAKYLQFWCSMSVGPNFTLVDAERVGQSIVVTFGDGTCVIYSASLLHTMMEHADKLVPEEDDDLTDTASA